MTDDAVSDASSGYFARILTTFAHYSHIYPFRLNMKKKLWLIHQHCTRVILDERGHHYWIVKELAQRGYEPVVFCSNFDHYSRKFVDESNPLFFERTLPCGAKCVFIRSNAYYNSGRDYARSLFLFYRNLMKVAKIYTTSPAPPPRYNPRILTLPVRRCRGRKARKEVPRPLRRRNPRPMARKHLCILPAKAQ